MVPRRMYLVSLLLVLARFTSAAGPRRRKDGLGNSRYITIYNQSGAKFDVFWVQFDGTLGPSNTQDEGMVYGGMTGIASFVGHSFEVREMGKCEALGNCRTTRFLCKDAEDQEYTIRSDELGSFYVEYKNAKSKAEEEAKTALEVCKSSAVDLQRKDALTLTDQFKALEECLLKTAQQKVDQSWEEVSFQTDVRVDLGVRLQNYTCDENPNYQGVNLTTTESIKNDTYWDDRQIQTLFESNENFIKLYKKFLDPSECDVILQATKGVKPSKKVSDFILQKFKSILAGPTGEKRFQSFSDILEKVTLIGRTSITTVEEATTQARLKVVCVSPDVEGGVMFFPKAGVRILPDSGDALVVWNHKIPDNKTDYVQEHTTCAVRTGTIVQVEDTFQWATEQK